MNIVTATARLSNMYHIRRYSGYLSNAKHHRLNRCVDTTLTIDLFDIYTRCWHHVISYWRPIYVLTLHYDVQRRHPRATFAHAYAKRRCYVPLLDYVQFFTERRHASALLAMVPSLCLLKVGILSKMPDESSWFFSNSRVRNFRRGMSIMLSTTRRRSSLWITPVTIDASLLDT